MTVHKTRTANLTVVVPCYVRTQARYQNMPPGSTYSDFLNHKRSIEDLYLDPSNPKGHAHYFFQDYLLTNGQKEDPYIYVDQIFTAGIINGRRFRVTTQGIKNPAADFPPANDLDYYPGSKSGIRGYSMIVEEISDDGRTFGKGVTFMGQPGIDGKLHNQVMREIFLIAQDRTFTLLPFIHAIDSIHMNNKKLIVRKASFES